MNRRQQRLFATVMARVPNTILVTNEWLEANIRAKGAMGNLCPRFMFILEGDTPSGLELIDDGLIIATGRRKTVAVATVCRQPYGESHAIWRDRR